MAAAHILQVAYYDTLRELRVKMLEAAGYQVTSVSGNDNAMGLDGAVIAGANLIVVGFSAPHSVHAAEDAIFNRLLRMKNSNPVKTLALVYFLSRPGKLPDKLPAKAGFARNKIPVTLGNSESLFTEKSGLRQLVQ